MLQYIFDTYKYVLRTAKNSALYPFYRVKYKLNSWLSVRSLIGRFVDEKIKGLQTSLIGKPKTLKDYIEFKRFYIAKSLLLVAAILCVVLPVLFYFYAYPFLVQKIGTATFVQTDNLLKKYNGKVKVLSTQKVLLYQGALKNGKREGKGELYDKGGSLIYKGSFAGGLRQGEGTEYYPNGNLKVTGLFKADVAEGLCVEYYDTGIIKYEGELASGLYNGQGKLYWENSKPKYTGQFLVGLYSGAGNVYDEKGVLIYEGDFKAGAYNGLGKLYQGDSKIKYSGDFVMGKYSGSGILYDENKNVSYEGMFVDGNFHGKGRSYKDSKLFYDGDFVKGVYSGLGKLYELEKDYLLYEGEFKSGSFNGSGILYNKEATAIYEGPFINNEINYAFLLGLPDADIRKTLGKKYETLMLEEGFCLVNPGVGISIYLNYYNDDMEAKSQTITVWGNQKVFGISPGFDINSIKKILGEPIEAAMSEITPEDSLAMERNEISSVYTAKYLIGKIPVVFCFDKKGGQWSYAVIGEKLAAQMPVEEENALEQ